MLPKCVRGGCLAAHRSKANKQGRLVERKVCFISDAGKWRRGWQPSVQRPTQPSDKQAVRAFIDKVVGVGGQHAETAPSSLTVRFKLVISGLTSIILVVVGTVNLQFQGPFVPISLQSVFRIVAAQVLGTAWSSCS